jgi:hypothetical protein
MDRRLDPILSLAFSLQANPGIYALLLGSGASRSAGIPTSWEITLDLTRQLAASLGADAGDDPAAWHTARYGTPPNYARLVRSLARSRTERSRLLRRYFEPGEEECSRGLKVPAAAHRAIAEMVAMGNVRVILTTNFDRLMERALEERGIAPVVIATPDAVEGALPLTHAECTVVKLHGDYLDSRARIVHSDLARYDARIDGLLDRVFDEFGLIVCGWSAEWDTALRSALQRCRNHRFSTYWTIRSDPGASARRLLWLRRAETIRIRDADQFFRDLVEKLRALREIETPHPLTARVAVARLKKYLESDQHRIRLHDLVTDEIERVVGAVTGGRFATEGIAYTPDEFRRRVRRYEAATGTLQALYALGCHWGGAGLTRLWVEGLERVAGRPEEPEGLVTWTKLRSYPGLLLLYAGGIAAVAAGRYATLRALLTEARARDSGRDRPICLHLNPGTVLSGETGWPLDGRDREHPAPVSDSLFVALRAALGEVISDPLRYEECFDRFEYFLGLSIVAARQAYAPFTSAPPARFWSKLPGPARRVPMRVIDEELEAQGADWPPLRDGLFAGDLEHFLALKERYDDFVLTARLRDVPPRAAGEGGAETGR